MTTIILVLCGIMTSFLSAIFGVGGGIIVVPVLRLLFPDVPIQSIAATSLMVVTLGALVNVILFRQVRHEINFKKLAIWCVAMLIGVHIGFFLSFLLPDRIIMMGFAFTLIVLAIKTLFFSYRIEQPEIKSDTLIGSLLSTIGGTIAGITGLGGGSVLAPLISQLPSVGTRQIAVYTNWMMFIGGIGSLWSYLTLTMDNPEHLMGKWQVGYVNFYVVAIIFASSLLMSYFSIKLKGVLSDNIARILFSGLLFVIASSILIALFS